MGQKKRVCDVVVSLGTGNPKFKNNEIKDELLGTIKMITDIATSSSKSWKELHLDNDRKVRIDPSFSQEFELDDATEVKKIQEHTRIHLATQLGQEALHRASYQLLASLLYVEALYHQLDTNTLEVVIRSRLPVNETLRKFILDSEFFVQVKGKKEANEVIFERPKSGEKPLQADASNFINDTFRFDISIVLPKEMEIPENIPKKEFLKLLSAFTQKFVITIKILPHIPQAEPKQSKPEKQGYFISGSPVIYKIAQST